MSRLPIRNVHQRRFAAEAATVGALLDRVGSPDDQLWPGTRWPKITVPQPITVGDRAGHADICYLVDDYRPGEALWFRFDPASGLEGRHGLVVEHCADGTVSLTHVLEGRAVGKGRVMWPLMIRAMHDQLLEELLDNAERLLPGAVRQIPDAERPHISGRSRWGRVLRSAFAGVDRLRRVPRPVAVGIAAGGLSGAALVHALWAAGMTWPGTDRVDLALKVVGTTVFPSDASTWAVAGLLSTATGLVVAGARPVRAGRAGRAVTVGLSAVAGVLALRSIGGFVVSGARLVVGRGSLFAPRDVLLYSPLCAVLAAATGSIAVHRTR
jgi:Protein of unknown function (DUF3995)